MDGVGCIANDDCPRSAVLSFAFKALITVDRRMNGPVGRLGGPMLPIARYSVCVCVCVATAVIQYCI
jgi:hypothetical protein